jgi:hypothetical protein
MRLHAPVYVTYGRRGERVQIGTILGTATREGAVRKFKLRRWGSCSSKPKGDGINVAEYSFYFTSFDALPGYLQDRFRAEV